MKVRRRMVIEIHSDDKAVEEADGGHDWLGGAETVTKKDQTGLAFCWRAAWPAHGMK